jgi:hypothetical protein
VLPFLRLLHLKQIHVAELAAVASIVPLPKSGSSVGISFILATMALPSASLFNASAALRESRADN